MDRTAAFFGAGTLLLVASLCLLTYHLRRTRGRVDWRTRRWPLARLGGRNTTERPGTQRARHRVIASATFILIAVDAFRRPPASAADRHSGTGGYALLVDLLLPIAHDPNQAERARGARPDRHATRRDRTIPRAARRRRELSESLPADKPAHPRRQPAASPTRDVSRSQIAGLHRRRAREPVAAAVRTAGRRAGAGHRRRQLDDLRAAQVVGRRDRAPASAIDPCV